MESWEVNVGVSFLEACKNQDVVLAKGAKHGRLVHELRHHLQVVAMVLSDLQLQSCQDFVVEFLHGHLIFDAGPICEHTCIFFYLNTQTQVNMHRVLLMNT